MLHQSWCNNQYSYWSIEGWIPNWKVHQLVFITVDNIDMIDRDDR